MNIKELKQYCKTYGIEVVGDKRLRLSYEDAVAKFESELEELELHEVSSAEQPEIVIEELNTEQNSIAQCAIIIMRALAYLIALALIPTIWLSAQVIKFVLRPSKENFNIRFPYITDKKLLYNM